MASDLEQKLVRLHQQFEDGNDSLFSDLPDTLIGGPDLSKGKDPRDVTIYDRGFSDENFESRISSIYKIRNKETSLMEPWGPLLRRNPPQKKLLRLILRGLRAGGPVRVLVLKNRRVGASTATIMLLLELCQLLTWDATILAHTAESSEKLLSIARNAYGAIPLGMKRPIVVDSKKQLGWGPNRAQRREGITVHQSNLFSMTAQGDYVASGADLRAMLLSECAKYDSVGDMAAQMSFILSAIGSVPKVGPSLIVAETTANGQQGWFWENWVRARKALEAGEQSEDGWIPFFISWIEDRSTDWTYRLPKNFKWGKWPVEDFAREKWLLSVGATPGQLYFRRYTIRNDMNMDFDYFDQEFPTDDVTAFLAGGRPAIPKVLIDKLGVHTAEPLHRFSASVGDVLGTTAWEVE